MQVIAQRGVLRGVDQVDHFGWIVVQVVELIRGHQVDDEFVASVADAADGLIGAEAIMIHFIPAPLDERFLAPG